MCIDETYGQGRRFELAQNNRQRVIPNVLREVKRQNPVIPNPATAAATAD